MRMLRQQGQLIDTTLPQAGRRRAGQSQLLNANDMLAAMANAPTSAIDDRAARRADGHFRAAARNPIGTEELQV